MPLRFEQSLTALRSPRSLARDSGLILGGAALTGICAQVSIPWQPVPFTLQTLAVTVCGLTLGARRGVASQIAYLAAGAAGAPVFAGGAGGPQHLVGPTAGYLVSFIFAAGLLGWLADRGWTRRLPLSALALVIGNALILLFGASWLSAYVGAEKAFAVGVLPFVWGSVLKSILALATLRDTWKANDKAA